MVVVALLVIGASLTVGLSGMNDTTSTATLATAQAELGKRGSKAILYAMTPSAFRRDSEAKGFDGAMFGDSDSEPLELGNATFESGRFSTAGLSSSDSLAIDYVNSTGIVGSDGNPKMLRIVVSRSGAHFVPIN